MYSAHGGLALFVLQEDNGEPHRDKSVFTYLAIEEGTLMKWHAHSPDINPIENGRGLMKMHLQKRTIPPTNPMHLFHILNQIWNSSSDSYFSNLVVSMPNCVRSVHVGKDRRNTDSLNLTEFS